MKITFKNVGQGDSIILEWKDENIKKIGFIDCCKMGKSNPSLEHLITTNLKTIDFILLTHPHQDHFSGLLSLLIYCEKENILIKKFIHTLRVEPRYLHWAIVGKEGRQQLLKIIEKVSQLYNNKKIIQQIYIELAGAIQLNKNWNLKCLSPSETEIRSYIKSVDLHKGINELKCSQAANLLSAVLKLEVVENQNFILLTADAEKMVFERLEDRHIELFKHKLLLNQIPHHGSVKNHKINFWQRFTKNTNSPAIVSAGDNKKYNHPNRNVIEDFDRNNFKVYATNNVNGMLDFINSKSLRKKIFNP